MTNISQADNYNTHSNLLGPVVQNLISSNYGHQLSRYLPESKIRQGHFQIFITNHILFIPIWKKSC